MCFNFSIKVKRTESLIVLDVETKIFMLLLANKPWIGKYL